MEMRTSNFDVLREALYGKPDLRFNSTTAAQILAERDILEAAKENKLIIIREQQNISPESIKNFLQYLCEKLDNELSYIQFSSEKDFSSINASEKPLFLEIIADDPVFLVKTICLSVCNRTAFCLYYSPNSAVPIQDNSVAVCLNQRRDGSLYVVPDIKARLNV